MLETGYLLTKECQKVIMFVYWYDENEKNNEIAHLC